MRTPLALRHSLTLLAAGILGLSSASAVQAATTSIMSSSASGVIGNNYSNVYTQISQNGRYVVFLSEATNLVPGDTNGRQDLFVKDTQTGEVKVATAAADGTFGNGATFNPAITPDGRYVAFSSESSNLVAGDWNGQYDVFVKDIQTGEIKAASRASSDEIGNTASSGAPKISADGRYVAFQSNAGNFFNGDGTNTGDIFVKDMQTGAITLVNSASDGTPGNSYTGYEYEITPDGRYVVFTSYASNLVQGDTNGTYDVFFKDLQTGETKAANADAFGVKGNGYSDYGQVSADGRYVSFKSGSTNLIGGIPNGSLGVFVKDMQTGEVKAANGRADGTYGNGSAFNNHRLSPDGRYVAFDSTSTNLADGVTQVGTHLYMKDLQTGEIRGRFFPIPGGSTSVGVKPYAISANGKYVLLLHIPYSKSCMGGGFMGMPAMCFDSPGTAQVYVWDSQTDAFDLISAGANGAPGNGASSFPVMTPDGNSVAFASVSSNLVTGDTNGFTDIFLIDRGLVAADEAAPEVTVTAPADGATYVLGQPVAADYTCSDAGSGIAASGGCVGTVANGAALDTSSLGAKSFTVDALDAEGNPASKTVSYTVIAGTNNAEFVSQNMISGMATGQRYVTGVTLKNTGTSYWTRERGFVLTSQNPLTNTVWGTNLRPLPAGVTVAPGESYTFQFTATAPSAPGTYNFQWRMAQSGVEWFGQYTPNVAVSVVSNDAQITAQTPPPAVMSPGQRAIVEVTVKNTGATTWTYGSAFVLSAQNPLANGLWGTSLRYLPGNVNVAPGQSHTFRFVATAPIMPGTYHFQWRMAQAGVGWFGEYSPDVVVTVGGPD